MSDFPLCLNCRLRPELDNAWHMCRECLHDSAEASRQAEMRLPGGLRDQFAMAALPLLVNIYLATFTIANRSEATPDLVSKDAYTFADAMLKAREK